MLKVENLVKKYGRATALDGVSLQLKRVRSSGSSVPTARENPPR